MLGKPSSAWAKERLGHFFLIIRDICGPLTYGQTIALSEGGRSAAILYHSVTHLPRNPSTLWSDLIVAIASLEFQSIPSSFISLAQDFSLWFALTVQSANALLHLAFQFGISSPPFSLFIHRRARCSFSLPLPMNLYVSWESLFSTSGGRGITVAVYSMIGDIWAFITLLLPTSDRFLPFQLFSFPLTLAQASFQFCFIINSWSRANHIPVIFTFFFSGIPMLMSYE